MLIFPYSPRRNQIEIMQSIRKTLEERKHLVFESGTGSGKTICAVTAALSYALENGKKIIYATRTNAQQTQVIIELRQLREKNKDIKDSILGIGIQGRTNTCILARKDPELASGTSEELSRFCSNIKKKTKLNGEGCIYYRNFLDRDKVEQAICWFKENLPTAEEFIKYCERKKICPYEINRLLVGEAKVVVVPYIYIFDPNIRGTFFDNLGVSERDIVLIVDEAHNLPDYIRELFSIQLSVFMLNSCIYELEKYGDPYISGTSLKVSDFCKILSDIIRDLRDTYVYGLLEDGLSEDSIKDNTDAFLPSNEFDEEILFRLKITSRKLHEIVGDLIAYGEKIRDYREKEGKLPRSYLHKLGLFLDTWFNLETEQYAKLIVDSNDGKNPRIESFCLDPSIGAKIIHDFHSSIHMSGTLEPLEEYRDSLGLPEDTDLISYPSPFPKENRRVLYVRDVTTRYEEIISDEKVIERMGEYISNICNNFPRNTIVFFPSFNVMSQFKKRDLLSNIKRYVYFEDQTMSQVALMELISDFKEHGTRKGDRAALFSVMGGRISEGLDFPAEQLEIAVIVGIPYPKPTARQKALQHYYDMKFGKGWEYTVEAPAARKMLQSIGRLIRNERDIGIAIILDRRAARFRKYIDDLKESKNVVEDIRNFLG